MIASRLVSRTISSASRAAGMRWTAPMAICSSHYLTGVRSSRPVTVARFSSSDSSHDDFAPKRKAVPDSEDETLKLIQDHVSQNKVMLYMKGNPSMPMCGFSARVVQILQKEGIDFASVNVLDYPSVREGVKKFSNWPTIPQLYVHGEFVGGCDIVTSMHESGELKSLLEESK
jgi:monothiol glutaredoxin